MQLNEEALKNPTQETFDEIHRQVRSEWEKMVDDSGQTEHMFIALDREAMRYLAMYKDIQDYAQSKGFGLPDLVEGVTVSVVSEGCEDENQRH